MEDIYIFIIISLIAFLASITTFFSGFGLGTILLVVFGCFFPMDIAVASTAIVHFINAMFKITITFKFIHWKTILYFGFFAVVGSILGSMLLTNISISYVIYHLTINSIQYEVYILDFVLSIIILLFTFWDLLKMNRFFFRKFNINFLGGLLTGFFGGLSGHQGSIRSMFLTKFEFSPLVFSATSAMLSFCVDITRISSYWTNMYHEEIPWRFVLIGIVFAIIGSFFGKIFLQKTEKKSFKIVLRFFLLSFAFCKLIGVI